MDLRTMTFLVVGATFALYIIIAYRDPVAGYKYR
jgi:hypothetical protein